MASSQESLPINDRENPYFVEAYPTPTTPSQFLSLLSAFPTTPTRELVQPYLSYETGLRKAFARPHAVVGGPDDLISIYDGHESSFRIRIADRETTAADKYIMPLKRKEVLGGQPAIAGSFAKFCENFDAFTHGILHDINWSNIVVAGSAALLPLLPRRKKRSTASAAVERPLENYFDNIAKASDIDIFLYGIHDEQVAIRRISEIDATIRKNQRIIVGEGLSLHTKNAVTFIAPRYPHRHVQVILRLYDSITEILTGFDVDCACVAFDGKKVYSSPRGITAISTRTNTVDLTRRSPSYENRLFKYRQHKFDVFWELLDRSQIQSLDFEKTKPWHFKGLARLVMFERLLQTGYSRPYYIHRNFKRVDGVRDPALVTKNHFHSSGYTSIEIPHSVSFTADKVRKFVKKHAKEPFTYGTLNELLCQRSTGWRSGEISPTLKFIKEDCGRQMIGSFYPSTADDWTQMAYGGLAENEEEESDENEESSSSDPSLPSSRSGRRRIKRWAGKCVAQARYLRRHWRSSLESKIRAIAHST
ncbi:uncharacterized protein EAE97_003897 [Botrytis byssoidea]|uniref:Uncharacterized protein n=1 Tax=Botrytis byssoidea TaxID=139641 RepID=A0A9P5ITB2_9HELO|nr:uncharacterized protein EAE97_003897 [Botrytis byssoidea]KAF7948486.1 hypothetical protein EAE97_003897 [Botrytis byssoidea]